MSAKRSVRAWAQEHMSALVLAPTGLVALVFIYGFILLTIYLSMSESRILPDYTFVGFEQWERLWGSRRWWTAITNLAVFGGLFIGFAILIGLALAIFLDQRIQAEGVIRTIYLYPMALSFIVTGTAWKWMLNPDLGFERVVQEWGFLGFEFNWLVQKETAIYCVVIAAVWQSSG
ncbi:MAG: sugar ABC transporter permease, partial [Pseudomonadota bacterium]